MRHRKTWGILGSFAGIAGSMAVLAYSAIVLMAITEPALATPNCIMEEFDLADAQVNEDVDTMIVMSKYMDLMYCYAGGGSCISEEFDFVDAEVNWLTSVNIRQTREYALAQCQAQ